MFDPRTLFRPTSGNPEGLARVRFGRGVVGNTTYATITLLVCEVAVCGIFRGDPIFALLAMVVIVLPYLFYLLGTWRFADKHPDRALLGDTEWLQHQKMTLQYAAKNYPNVPVAPLGPNPNLLENGEKDVDAK